MARLKRVLHASIVFCRMIFKDLYFNAFTLFLAIYFVARTFYYVDLNTVSYPEREIRCVWLDDRAPEQLQYKVLTAKIGSQHFYFVSKNIYFHLTEC